MKRYLLLVVIALFCSFLTAQSDEILDKLYEEDNAKTLITSLLVLQASSHLTFNSTVDDAREYLETTKWGNSILEDGQYITKGGFALLVMKAFDLPHGIMYGLLPIRRYALKEMIFSEYILGNPYPNDIMGSFDVIYTLSSLTVNQDINKNYIDVEFEEESSETELTNSESELEIVNEIEESETEVSETEVIDSESELEIVNEIEDTEAEVSEAGMSDTVE